MLGLLVQQSVVEPPKCRATYYLTFRLLLLLSFLFFGNGESESSSSLSRLRGVERAELVSWLGEGCVFRNS
jgi:hypothetical protein